MIFNQRPTDRKLTLQTKEEERIMGILQRSTVLQEMRTKRAMFLSSRGIKNLLDKVFTERVFSENENPLEYFLSLFRLLAQQKVKFSLNLDVLQKIVSIFSGILERDIKSSELLSILSVINDNVDNVSRDLAKPATVAKIISLCADVDNPQRLKKFLNDLRNLNETFNKARTTVFILNEILDKNILSKDIAKIQNAIKMCEQLINSDKGLEDKSKQIEQYKLSMLLAHILTRDLKQASETIGYFVRKLAGNDAGILENTEVTKVFLIIMAFAAQDLPEVEVFNTILNAFKTSKSELIVNKINDDEYKKFSEREKDTSRKIYHTPLTVKKFWEDIYSKARQYNIELAEKPKGGARTRVTPFWRISTSGPINHEANIGTNFALEDKD